MEHVVVIGICQILRARNDEALGVAEQHAVNDQRVVPIDDQPQQIRRPEAGEEARAAVCTAHEQPQQQTESKYRRPLFLDALPLGGRFCAGNKPQLYNSLNDLGRIVELCKL